MWTVGSSAGFYPLELSFSVFDCRSVDHPSSLVNYLAFVVCMTINFANLLFIYCAITVLEQSNFSSSQVMMLFLVFLKTFFIFGAHVINNINNIPYQLSP